MPDSSENKKPISTHGHYPGITCKRAFPVLLVMIALCGICFNARAQKSALTPYTYLIDYDDSGYSGPGVDWILSEAEKNQFLLFGEPHGVVDVPRFVLAMYERLHSSGFKHLILEIDATTSKELSQHAFTDFISQYPHSIAFDYDGELQLMEKVQTMNPGEQVIWGMDQMVVAIHAFQLLEKVAIKLKTKRLCRGLHLKATLKAGRYIHQEHFKDLDQLELLFGEEENEEGLNIVSQIRTSAEIYAAYHAASRGEISYQFSSLKREEYMKEWFDDFVSKTKVGEELPKAILKMGGTHTAYGIGPNGVLTLGDHLNKLVEKAGNSILSIGMANVPADIDFPPRTLFHGKKAVLLDNRAVLNELDSITLAGYTESFRKKLRYFDATLYLNDAPRSAKQLIGREEKKFVRRSIMKLVPYALLVLLNLSLIFLLFKWLFQRVFKKESLRADMGYHLLLLGMSLVLDLVLISQIFSILSGKPFSNAVVMSPDMSFLIFLGLFLLSTAVFMLIRKAVRKALWSPAVSRYYGLVAIGNLLLVVYMYYWNMGGMLA